MIIPGDPERSTFSPAEVGARFLSWRALLNVSAAPTASTRLHQSTISCESIRSRRYILRTEANSCVRSPDILGAEFKPEITAHDPMRLGRDQVVLGLRVEGIHGDFSASLPVIHLAAGS